MHPHINTSRVQFDVYLVCFELFMSLCHRIIIFRYYYFDVQHILSFAAETIDICLLGVLTPPVLSISQH